MYLSLIRETVHQLRKNFFTFFPVTTLTAASLVLWQTLSIISKLEATVPTQLGRVIAFLIWFWLCCAEIHYLSKFIGNTEQSHSYLDSLKFSLRRLPQFLWVDIRYASQIIVGVVLFVIPGIYWATIYWAASWLNIVGLCKDKDPFTESTEICKPKFRYVLLVNAFLFVGFLYACSICRASPLSKNFWLFFFFVTVPLHTIHRVAKIVLSYELVAAKPKLDDNCIFASKHTINQAGAPSYSGFRGAIKWMVLAVVAWSIFLGAVAFATLNASVRQFIESVSYSLSYDTYHRDRYVFSDEITLKGSDNFYVIAADGEPIGAVGFDPRFSTGDYLLTFRMSTNELGSQELKGIEDDGNFLQLLLKYLQEKQKSRFTAEKMSDVQLLALKNSTFFDLNSHKWKSLTYVRQDQDKSKWKNYLRVMYTTTDNNIFGVLYRYQEHESEQSKESREFHQQVLGFLSNIEFDT